MDRTHRRWMQVMTTMPSSRVGQCRYLCGCGCMKTTFWWLWIFASRTLAPSFTLYLVHSKPLKTEEQPLLDWIHSGSWCKSTQKGRTDKNKGIFEIYAKFSVDLCTEVKIRGAPIFSKRALKMPPGWKLVQNWECLHSGFLHTYAVLVCQGFWIWFFKYFFFRKFSL